MAEHDRGGDGMLVELFLASGRVQGVTYEVRDRRRLVDVLTDPRSAFKLESARLMWQPVAALRELGPLNVEKRSIVAAIPHETERQLRERSMQRLTVGRSETRPVQATVLLPPFIVEGSVHVPVGTGGAGSSLTADAAIFGRFFPVTDATLTLPGGAVVEASILLINRDVIAAISVRD